ncbi:hypothetical protein FSP39_023996 [Pinctada imbricata]|uniref:3'(2'),5'-bisphosphate nucleotidase 1 n=1 Tax=Pinctada imbricata TaxID=66713 RepID=A0AA88XYB4_PINIB|nr:hypothetical protein FSP39_023996 [Pinctada imbricata]
MASSPLIMRLVSASVAVSNRASGIIRDIMKSGNLGIVEKGKNDLQTEADRSAQRCIVASLHKRFPEVAIFGEEALDPSEKIPAEFLEHESDEYVLKQECPEYLRNVADEDVVIWVDPLDGTAEFTQGFLDHVTVLIGIAVKGNAVAGVINQPWYNYQNPDKPLGRTIWGVMGLGGFGFLREVPPKDKLIVTTSRSHSNMLVTETVHSLNPNEVVRVGGTGHKVLLLIEGKVHAYVFASKGCKKWDTCAPEAVLHAVGGCLTDLHGIKMNYAKDVQRQNTGGMLATLMNEEDHRGIVAKIPELAKDAMEQSSPAPELDFMGAKFGQNPQRGSNSEEKSNIPIGSNKVPSEEKKQAVDQSAVSPTPSTDSQGTTSSKSSQLSDSVQKETCTTKL